MVSAVGKCGPDITDNLKSVLQDVETTWAGWSARQRASHLAAVFLPPGLNSNAEGSWDIDQLHNKTQWIFKDCPGCPTGICASDAGTVSVNGRCFRPFDVNYVLLGRIAKLGNLPQEAVLSYVYGRKALIPKVAHPDTVQWAMAGYIGWPSGLTPLSWSLSKAVVGTRKAKTPFTFTWLEWAR